MPSYVALAIKEPAEANWSVLIPDFPEIASVAERPEDVFAQAQDALAMAVEARLEAGETLPEPTAPENIEPDAGPIARVLLLSVPAESSGPAVRVNMSLDRLLLSRIDAAAHRRGMSRSAFVAEGARRMLRDG